MAGTRHPWVEDDAKINWQILERIYKHYPEFHEFYIATGQQEITLDNGLVVNIHDVLRGISELPPRQKQAVTLVCLLNYTEREAANIMGFERFQAPVGSYKRAALKKIIKQYWSDAAEGDFR